MITSEVDMEFIGNGGLWATQVKVQFQGYKMDLTPLDCFLGAFTLSSYISGGYCISPPTRLFRLTPTTSPGPKSIRVLTTAAEAAQKGLASWFRPSKGFGCIWFDEAPCCGSEPLFTRLEPKRVGGAS